MVEICNLKLGDSEKMVGKEESDGRSIQARKLHFWSEIANFLGPFRLLKKLLIQTIKFVILVQQSMTITMSNKMEKQ